MVRLLYQTRGLLYLHVPDVRSIKNVQYTTSKAHCDTVAVYFFESYRLSQKLAILSFKSPLYTSSKDHCTLLAKIARQSAYTLYTKRRETDTVDTHVPLIQSSSAKIHWKHR